MSKKSWLTNLYRRLAIPSVRSRRIRRQSGDMRSAIVEHLESRKLLTTVVGPAAPTVIEVLQGSGPFVVHSGDRLTVSVPSLSVVFSENLNAVPGGLNGVTNRSNWDLTRYGVDISDQISGITFGQDPNTNLYVARVSFSHPLSEGGYQLVAFQRIQDLSGHALNGDGNSVNGADFHCVFAVATTVPAGPEQRVNTVTGGNQTEPAVAMNAHGDYVAVWSSYDEDGSGFGVYAQRYRSDGKALGGEFRVNTYTAGYQGKAAVAMDAAGDFVVTWESFGQSGPGSGMGIYAQRYNAAGVAQGSEFHVNTYGTLGQESPSVAMDSAGDFVIAWWNRESAPNGSGCYAQRYNAAGIAQGTETKVNTPIAGFYDNAALPKVAMDAVGDFVVTWTQQPFSGQSGTIAQRYNASGAPQGSAFVVSPPDSGSYSPVIAMDAAGDFIVAWDHPEPVGGGISIYARRYNSLGVDQGLFPVTDSTTVNQITPAVAMDAAGNSIVAWRSLGPGYHYYAKRYDNAGTALSPEFQVNTTYAGYASTDPPAVAVDNSGDLIVAWRDDVQDGSGSGIYSQHFLADVAPVLSQIEATPVVDVAPLAVPITSSLLVFDYDGNNLTGATIQVSGNYQPDLDRLIFANASTPKITASWNALTGALTLSGQDTISDYRTALRNISFQNVYPALNTSLSRSISFQVTDGLLSSNVVSRDVTIVVPPTLSGTVDKLNYIEKSVPLIIAPNLVATDPNSVNFVSAAISFSNWQAEDRLSYSNLFGLQASFTQDLVAHTSSLIITGNDTIAHYQTMLRSIGYYDSSSNPVTTPRAVSIVTTDGVFTSNKLNVNVSVTSVNDPPSLSGIESSPLIYKANAAPQSISSTVQVNDPDSNYLTKLTVQITAGYQNNSSGHDVLSFKNQLGITGVFDSTSGTLTLSGFSILSNYQTALRSIQFNTSGRAISGATRTLKIVATDNYLPTPASSLPITRNITVQTSAPS